MSKIIQKITAVRKKVEQFRPFSKEQESAIQERLRAEWTYNSNAIEGNTLTFGETLFFLREGLTSEGRPLKDYLEAKNHVEAIDGLEDIIQNKRPLTEGLIKELHGVLMRGMEFSLARGAGGQIIRKEIHIGQYKIQPNHVLTLSGKIHHYADPLHVKDKMEELLKWYHSKKELHPVERAAIFHYKFVSIHPFDDGNGRMARLLMNLILMKSGYLPCIIKTAHRKKYLEALETVDKKKNFADFVQFVGEELLETLETILSVLKGEDTAVLDGRSLNQAEREDLIKGILGKEKLRISQIHARLLQIPRPTLKFDLKRLCKKRVIKKIGKGKGTLYFTG
ncbi:MAG: Fic family protein [Candidatus Gracilibacteria bacterium]|jgi:Fic family protein